MYPQRSWSCSSKRRKMKSLSSSSSSGALLERLLLLLLLLLPSPAPAVVGLTTDGVLLLSFKYTVLIDPLAVLSSWNYDDATPCSWNGVVCAAVSGPGNGAATSRVISLVLPNAKLLGSIPADLGLLEHLRHLDLSGNSLHGTLPSTLFSSSAAADVGNVTVSSSSELRMLSLAGNEISGKIPEIAAGNLSYLQVLNLSDNALVGGIPTGLALLPNLTVLSLTSNYLSGDLPGGGFDSAEYIDFSSNLLNGTLPPDFAGGGGNLRYLNLSNNRLAGEIPTGFAGKVPAGAAVDLSNNNLTGVIADSGPLLNQTPMAFAGNPGLCGKPLSVLCTAPPTLSDPVPNGTSGAGAPPPAPASDSPPAFAAIPKTVNGVPPGGMSTSGVQKSSGQGGRLGPAAISGIIAGDLAGIGLLFMIFLYLYQAKKKKKNRQQQQEQQQGRGIGPSKVANLTIKQQQQQQQQQRVSSSSAASQNRVTTGGSGGGILFCLGKKSDDGNDSDESSDATGSDTEEEHCGGIGEVEKLKSLNGHPPQQQQKLQGGVLVTVDGETELELETLLKASAYILGSAGSSIVYKAVLADGTAFAVRRIGECAAADKLKDFEAQVRSIAKLRHPNLVTVRGFYFAADEKLLISDYAPNGSVANISYKKMGSSPFHLPWETRLRIARGVVRGLAFLHEKKCIHGNLKPSNILLGPEMEPWIGDFGLERLAAGDGGPGRPGFSARHFGSKRSTHSQSSLQDNASPSAGGTAAAPYHAPESLRNLKPNTKSDVYSFGVVLLELLAGRVFSEAELCQWNAIAGAGGMVAEEGNRVVARMVDSALRGEVEGKEEALLACFRLGFSCASLGPQRRPTMKDALQVLDRVLIGMISSSDKSQSA